MNPLSLGFKMPPEWFQHSRTLMAWPVKEALWPEPFTDILPAFTELVSKIAQFEPVALIARPSLVEEAVRYCGSEVKVLSLEHNDSWLRDIGPTIVMNQKGELAGINWIFNGWGDKYPCEKDNQIAPKVLTHYGIPRFDAPLVMEGGSFHVDGLGTLLTTTECLLNPNRNPQLSRKDIENTLKRYLNVKKIIWLKRGWVGDDTDGHVDNISCFARPGVILTQVCSDPGDPNYEISVENMEILKTSADARGKAFQIITVEQPPAIYYQDVRLTLSYLNFYFVNGGIILPVFGGPAAETDAAAIRTFEQTFPNHRIVTVDGSVLARGGGNVHCLTQQMPVGKPAPIFSI